MFKICDPARMPFVMSEDENFKIVVLSDLHVGGRTGYLPSGCVHERGEENRQSVDQKNMERNLLAKLREIGPVDKVFFLGDLVDGKNVTGGGIDISNVNVQTQIEWCVLACKSFIDILKPSDIGFIEGSPYHTENSSDRAVARMISLAYPDINVYMGLPSLKFYLGQKLWFLEHEFAGANKPGALYNYWKEINTRHYDRGRTPDVLGYGHLHQGVPPTPLKNGKNPVYGFVCPGQKLYDAFCGRGPKGPFDWEIGFLHIIQEGVELWGRHYNTYRYWEIEQ